jgi:peptidoglycan/xylan/chitin deacetylase (PgdA/CDA1 family)
LLDVLERFGVSATFFVTGRNLGTPQAQDLLARMVSEGHQIGNHTYSHPHLTELGAERIRECILKTEKLIGDADRGIKVFRPPFGDHNSLVDQIVQELGYRLVLWNVDTLDWHPEYQDHWVKHAMTQIVAQRVTCVLAHDPLTTTVDHVGSLIAKIRELSGSKFITATEAFPSPPATHE